MGLSENKTKNECAEKRPTFDDLRIKIDFYCSLFGKKTFE